MHNGSVSDYAFHSKVTKNIIKYSICASQLITSFGKKKKSSFTLFAAENRFYRQQFNLVYEMQVRELEDKRRYFTNITKNN